MLHQCFHKANSQNQVHDLTTEGKYKQTRETFINKYVDDARVGIFMLHMKVQMLHQCFHKTNSQSQVYDLTTEERGG